MSNIITADNITGERVQSCLDVVHEEYREDIDSYVDVFEFAPQMRDIVNAGGLQLPSAQSIISQLCESASSGADDISLGVFGGTEVFLCPGCGYNDWEETYDADIDIAMYPVNDDDFEWTMGGIVFNVELDWGPIMYPYEDDERRAMRLCYERLVEEWNALYASYDFDYMFQHMPKECYR